MRTPKERAERNRQQRRRYRTDLAFRVLCNMRTRDGHTMRAYGLTWEQARKLRRRKCKICSTLKVRRVLDHNHTTKAFRGVLCHFCNIYLGWYERHYNRIEQYMAGTRRTL